MSSVKTIILRRGSKLDKQNLAKRIRLLRGTISQREFADRLNTHQTFISEMEKGKSRPSVDVAFALSELCGVSMDYIYKGKNYSQTNGGTQSFVGLNNGRESESAIEILRLMEIGIRSISECARKVREMDSDKEARIKTLQDQVLNLKPQEESQLENHYALC